MNEVVLYVLGGKEEIGRGPGRKSEAYCDSDVGSMEKGGKGRDELGKGGPLPAGAKDGEVVGGAWGRRRGREFWRSPRHSSRPRKTYVARYVLQII